MNKKGIFGMALVNVFSIIVLITILLVFYFLFSMPKTVTGEVITPLEVDEGNFFLINYLRTPVEIGGEKMEMADLISKYVEDKNFYDGFKMNTEKILKSVSPEDMCSSRAILLRSMPGNKKIKNVEDVKVKVEKGERKVEYEASTLLPLFKDTSKNINVTLSVKCTLF